MILSIIEQKYVTLIYFLFCCISIAFLPNLAFQFSYPQGTVIPNMKFSAGYIVILMQFTNWANVVSSNLKYIFIINYMFEPDITINVMIVFNFHGACPLGSNFSNTQRGLWCEYINYINEYCVYKQVKLKLLGPWKWQICRQTGHICNGCPLDRGMIHVSLVHNTWGL